MDAGKSKQILYLSEFDEGVRDEDFIGLYTLFTNSENKIVYMGKDRCQNMRKELFDNSLRIFRKYTGESFADFFNYTIDEIGRLGENPFVMEKGFSRIANSIKAYEVKLGRGGLFKYSVSFGINKKLAYEHFEKIEKGLFDDEEIELEQNKKDPEKRQEILNGKEHISVTDDYIVAIERNAIMRKFQHWCALQKIDARAGIIIAFEELFKTHPNPKLKPTREYESLTELDKLIINNPKTQKGVKKRIEVELPKSLLDNAEIIIERYNRDVNNLAKEKLRLETYLSNAILLLNKKMPLKYRNPKLYLEEVETGKVAVHNERNKTEKTNSEKET